MSVSDEKAIITIEVQLVSKVTGDPIPQQQEGSFLGESTDDIRGIISEEINTNLKDAIDDALEDEGVDIKKLQELSGAVKDLDKKAMGNLQSIAKNPENFMESTMMNVLSKAGPYGALAAAIISAIAGTPALVSAVIEALGVKGGILNQDFKFSQEEQYNQQFDRRVQYRRLTGDDPLITLESRGFVVGDPDFVDNSLVSANAARTGRIGLRESSLGMIHGI